MPCSRCLARTIAGTLSGLLALAFLPPAFAEPSEARPGPTEGGPPPAHRDPLRAALDANHDFELDAEEIAKAPDAIKSLDKNGDGRLDREELRPPMGPPPGGPGRGPGDRGPGDRGGEARPRRPGEGGDRPSPERFLERAKSFDADGDGKLDEAELTSWAEAMAERMRGRGPDGAGGPPRGDGERPERPRRPE